MRPFTPPHIAIILHANDTESPNNNRMKFIHILLACAVISSVTHAQVDYNEMELADFIMFTQRSFLLNLSKELNKGNVSFAQFFLPADACSLQERP